MKGLYIYGLIPNYYSSDQFREMEKLNVLSIPYGKISAIVAETEIIDYSELGAEPLARHLLNHQQTIEAYMKMGFNTIIPMQLGTFAENTKQVKKIIETGYDLILQTFEKISGFIEIDIVTTWADFQATLGEIAKDPQVMALKSEIQQKETITPDDQMHIGIMVKKMLDQKSSELSNTIFNSLEPFSQKTKQHELLNDQMISNTAFMVNQQQQLLIEKALDELDVEMNGRLNFKMVGPLPCYSFFTLEAKLMQYYDLLDAAKGLDLNGELSEKIIRQAYLSKVKLYHPDQNPDDEASNRFTKVQQDYQLLLNYFRAQKPESENETIEIAPGKVSNDFYIIKIKD
ncbi:MAG: GvpL/GvpF family gas vesicle protein [Bacteroidales bacterium]|nr:GvpL/GvpF family gas vesicle protein [Bacteroidales bacterium]MCF8345458.1 GvpL/GvpF family gas vesicle protein [Bacteroidales bacterium]MCF8350140.1 GvpL/GvpF family gas vesicle protein [Bacteroidales bacterium]